LKLILEHSRKSSLSSKVQSRPVQDEVPTQIYNKHVMLFILYYEHSRNDGVPQPLPYPTSTSHGLRTVRGITNSKCHMKTELSLRIRYSAHNLSRYWSPDMSILPQTSVQLAIQNSENSVKLLHKKIISFTFSPEK